MTHGPFLGHFQVLHMPEYINKSSKQDRRCNSNEFLQRRQQWEEEVVDSGSVCHHRLHSGECFPPLTLWLSHLMDETKLAELINYGAASRRLEGLDSCGGSWLHRDAELKGRLPLYYCQHRLSYNPA